MSNVNEMNEVENTVDQNPEIVAELQAIEEKYVTRRQACDQLGIRVTNTAKPLEGLAAYTIYDRIVYDRNEVDELAKVRLEKNAEKADRRKEQLAKMEQSLRKAQERTEALAQRIKAAQNGANYANNPVELTA